MMKTFLYIGCVIALCVLCTSCSSLKCKHFPGKQEMITEKKLSDDSVWKFGEMVYHVKVAECNRVVASWVEWDDKAEKHKMDSFPVVVSKLDDTMFLNLKVDQFYTILRAIPSGDDSIILLTIDDDKLEADIEKGIIKGTKKDGDYILDCTKQDLENYIKANLNTLFSLEAAGILKLIEGKMK